MMKQQIWIASHFHNQSRYELFVDTIKSIAEQTIKPDLVVISYSKQHNVVTDILSIFKRYLEPLNILFKIYKHDTRLYKFEHIKYIFDTLNSIDNILITFCDDDDLLISTRLEENALVLKKENIKQDMDVKIKCYIQPLLRKKSNHIPSSEKYTCSCTSKHLELFMKSSIFSATNPLLNLEFLNYTLPTSCIFLIPKYLYLHRVYSKQYGMRIWMYRKIETETPKYIEFLNYSDKYFKKYEKYEQCIHSIYFKGDESKLNIKSIENLKNYISNLWLSANGNEFLPREFMKMVIKKVKINISKIPVSDGENSVSSSDKSTNKNDLQI